MGAKRGTNQIGELCGVMHGLLWLLEYPCSGILIRCCHLCRPTVCWERASGILEEELQRGADNGAAISVGACVSDEECDMCAHV
jgi:hypothetical protein